MARKKKKGGVLEGLFVGLLLLVVLIFGLSIADRWRPGGMDRSGARRIAAEPSDRPSDLRGATEEDLGQKPLAVPATGRPTVEVLNGTDRNGLALEATRWLRKSGFDVVEYGNAGRIYEKTILIDRVGKGNAPQRLLASFQETYGVGSLETDVVEVSGADLRVILGQDFSEAWASPRGVGSSSSKGEGSSKQAESAPSDR